MSPQFHVKFDDFFETVRDKSTDFDAQDPEWKYLSGFAVRKDQERTDSAGLIDRLITPRRKLVNPVTKMPSNGPTALPIGLHQDQSDLVVQDAQTHPQEGAISDA